MANLYRNRSTGQQAAVHPKLTGYYDAHPLWVPVDPASDDVEDDPDPDPAPDPAPPATPDPYPDTAGADTYHDDDQE